VRRATLRTELDRADAVAAAVEPDNTEQMTTRVEDGAVVTTIERETTGGLRSTVDDYVVNLDVATRTMEATTRYGDGTVAERHDESTTDHPHDTQP